MGVSAAEMGKERKKALGADSAALSSRDRLSQRNQLLHVLPLIFHVLLLIFLCLHQHHHSVQSNETYLDDS